MNHSKWLPEQKFLWPSGSFLAYGDISEAAWMLPKCSISVSNDRRVEEHGGVEENKRTDMMNFNH
jgi:hypothetical protein